MAKRKFTDYSEIAAVEVKSQQDYLMKYIAGRRQNANYAYYRNKMPPKEDGSRHGIGGLVTWEERQRASDRTCSEINSRKWNDSDDSELRRLRKYIEHFFQGLDIDPNLFKKGRKYQMTDELIEFFDFILNNDEGITSQITGRKFSNVSNRIYRYIYSCLLAALRTAPCSEEEKNLAKKRFLALMNKNGVDLAFQSKNEIVDAILRITWEKLWKKGGSQTPANSNMSMMISSGPLLPSVYTKNSLNVTFSHLNQMDLEAKSCTLSLIVTFLYSYFFGNIPLLAIPLIRQGTFHFILFRDVSAVFLYDGAVPNRDIASHKLPDVLVSRCSCIVENTGRSRVYCYYAQMIEAKYGWQADQQNWR